MSRSGTKARAVRGATGGRIATRRGLPTLALVTALSLLPAGYAARADVISGTLQLVSAVTGGTPPAASGPPAAAPPPAAPPPAAPAAAEAAAGPSAPAGSAAHSPAAVRVHAASGNTVRAASVVPMFAPPAPPLPPMYPWLMSGWTTATASSNELCLPRFGPGYHPQLTVRTTATSAVASWTHNGDPTVQAYWLGWHVDVGTLAQSTAPIQWLKVTPPAGCTGVTTTLPNLASGHYRLWMELDVYTPELAGPKSSRVGVSETHFDIP